MDKGMNDKLEAELVNKSEPDELKNIIEAAIMVSDEPITVDRLIGMFTDATKPERSTVNELLLELQLEYANRGFELKRIDKGYRLQTREEYSPWLARLRAGRPPRYSRALLETLAIIAYRQPVTRGEIEEIRGVAVSTDIIRTLVDREWVRQVGVRDVPGKPALFATTRSFLEYFNLEGLTQLPSLQDIRDLETIADELNMKLPLEGRDEKIGDNNDSSDAEVSPQTDFIENTDSDDIESVNNEEPSSEGVADEIKVDETTVEETLAEGQPSAEESAASSDDEQSADEDANRPS
jgi:segregation and condensation protein B